MAFSFIADDGYSTSSGSLVPLDVPAGTASGDCMLAIITRYTTTASPSAVPSGWTTLASTTSAGGLGYCGIFYKVAGSSEPASYTWTWAAAAKSAGICATYRGANPADPVGVYSNTQYTTSDTTLRGASVTAVADSSLLLMAGVAHYITSVPTITEPSGMTQDSHKGNTASDMRTTFCSLNIDAGSTGNKDATIDVTTADKHAFLVVLKSSVPTEVNGGPYSFSGGSLTTAVTFPVAGGSYSFSGGSVTVDVSGLLPGAFTFSGGSITPTLSMAAEAGPGAFTLSGGSVAPSISPVLSPGAYNLTGGVVSATWTVALSGGTFSFSGGIPEVPVPLAGGVFAFTGATLSESQPVLNISLYRDALSTAQSIFACDSFSNDTVGNYIWERTDRDKDLILGDGTTSSTFPTFTTDTDKFAEYYAFDGVDDYLGNWPTTAGFVSAAFSSSYPDGQPYVTQVTDDTVKDLLTVSGAFTGNLHSLVFYSTEPTTVDKALLADYQLRRLWRDTIVDPYTARLIRDGSAVQVYDMQWPSPPFTDYALGGAADPTDTLWDKGVTFNDPNAVVTVSDVVDLRSQTGVTLFVSGDMSTGQVIEKGTNYSLSIITFPTTGVLVNGVAIAVPGILTAASLAVTLVPGNAPRAYVDGEYVATGGSAITLPTGSDDLLIGNTSGGGSVFGGTLRRASVYTRVLQDEEIRLLHYSAARGYNEILDIDRLVGLTDDGTTTASANRHYLTQATATRSGNLGHIAAYCSTAGNIKPHIYSDTGADYPDTLLVYPGDCDVVADWNYLKLLSGVSITRGTKYWIGVVNGTTMWGVGTSATSLFAAVTYSTFDPPTTFPGSGYTAYTRPLAMYGHRLI